MIETAILTIKGERFLFRSFDNGLGENAERDRHSISTTAADPLLKMAVATRGVGAVPHPSGLGSTRLFSSSHGGLNSPEGQHHHA